MVGACGTVYGTGFPGRCKPTLYVAKGTMNTTIRSNSTFYNWNDSQATKVRHIDAQSEVCNGMAFNIRLPEGAITDYTR
jgi:hypothetical protein